MIPTDIDWARLAAFLDGEGSIRVCIQTKKLHQRCLPTYAITLCVGNTNPVLMAWLQERFEGTVAQKRNGGDGRRPFFEWRVGAKGGKQKYVLEGCLPFFVLKRSQAEMALKLIEIVKRNKSRPRPKEVVEEQHRTAIALNEQNLTRGKHLQFRLPVGA